MKANSCAKYFDGTIWFQDLTSVANLVRDPALLLNLVEVCDGSGFSNEPDGGLDITSRATREAGSSGCAVEAAKKEVHIAWAAYVLPVIGVPETETRKILAASAPSCLQWPG